MIGSHNIKFCPLGKSPGPAVREGAARIMFLWGAVNVWIWLWKTIGCLFYATPCFLYNFIVHSHLFIQAGVTVRKRQILVKIGDFLSRVTLKFDGWPWKKIGHLVYATLSFVHHFIAIGEFKLELESGNTPFGSKWAIFVPHNLEIWRLVLKNNMALLPLCYFKLCVSFRSHSQFKLEL